jgi:hypothetical protein
MPQQRPESSVLPIYFLYDLNTGKEPPALHFRRRLGSN